MGTGTPLADTMAGPSGVKRGLSPSVPTREELELEQVSDDVMVSALTAESERRLLWPVNEEQLVIPEIPGLTRADLVE